ncbi:Ribonuclease H protein [Abeliophyllum distichum]|uniref:Ribonuclease H protein n=1 Tax=Abeliophyllum distichum TaxID=126358 RepID=A0ABD1PRJ8_9LAMI
MHTEYIGRDRKTIVFLLRRVDWALGDCRMLLIHSQGLLWAQFLLSKYCRDTHPLLATIPYNASPVWKRLKYVSPQAETCIAWQLGRGQIFFWHGYWMGESTLAD